MNNTFIEIKTKMLRVVMLLALSLCGGVAGGLFSSCSDFLKEEDKDQVIPRTIEQYEAMLHQHGFLKVTWFYKSDLMTDDITENASATTTAKNPYKGLYAWARDVERTGSGERTSATNNMWEQLYNDVLVANYIIERADDAEGTQSQRDYLIGEAYFLRARSYLELVNIYAPVYEASTANAPGVPLRLGTGVVNDYERNSVGEVYRQIESDLKDAVARFDASKETMSLWHPNKKAALLLLSRTYLYKGEWQKVVDTASELIAMCPQGLYNLRVQPNSPVVTKSNPEVLHSFGSCSELIITDNEGVQQNDVPNLYKDNSSSIAVYGVSKSLSTAYHTGDCRPYTYFFPTSSGIDVPAKWHTQFTKLGAYSYRLAEAYLSRAEAYAALGTTDKALEDVRKVIATRVEDINKVAFPSVNAGDYALQLRKFIVDERRLEFCGENHRWFDLRRTTSWYPQELTHVFTLSVSANSSSTGVAQGTETYTLKAQSPNYTFELPESETEVNGAIAPYELRETISPVTK
ncbi:MAG: RagB/SusD family nutrient uptake outer membrane protein [Prevotellaceae bacterium]|nr:RagB/SusD family nutrient uptake outer membrane protein [Candidatus Minthosoma caballi]